MNRLHANRPFVLALRTGLMILVAVGVVGCRGGQSARPAQPTPTVTVVKAERRNVPIEIQNIGTTRSLRDVTIRARVSGRLIRQNFKEGTDVEGVSEERIKQMQDELNAMVVSTDHEITADDLDAIEERVGGSEGRIHPLLVIEEAPYLAAVNSAKATLAQAEADLRQSKESKAVAIAQAQLQVSQAMRYLAEIQESRARRLLERNSITRDEYDEKNAGFQQTKADEQTKSANLDQSRVSFDSNIAMTTAKLAKTRADLASAVLDLTYCRMYAPVNGRIGELQIKLGNYVTGVDKTALVTIQQLDPMGVDIRPSSRLLPQITAMVRKEQPIQLVIQGDLPFPHPGQMTFIDNTVDPMTSTFLLKASVPNPDQVLLPGDYVKTYATVGEYTDVLVVPERAVMEGQNGPFVFVASDGGQVGRVEVRALDTYRGLRVLENGATSGKGIKPDQLVLVDNLQLVRPGMPVKTELKPLADVMPLNAANVTNPAPATGAGTGEAKPPAAAPPPADKPSESRKASAGS